MRTLFKSLTLEHVKDYVQIGAGVAAIIGGLITAGAIFLSGGDDSPSAAVVPTETPAAAIASPTPEPTAAPTDTPEPEGEFLRVEFGTQQDPSTLLPSGDTAVAGEELRVCAGETLFAWVYHSYEPGSVIEGRISDRAGVLFNASVPVAPGATHFWISARVSEAGTHTLSVEVQGGEQRAEWGVEVVC